MKTSTSSWLKESAKEFELGLDAIVNGDQAERKTLESVTIELAFSLSVFKSLLFCRRKAVGGPATKHILKQALQGLESIIATPTPSIEKIAVAAARMHRVNQLLRGRAASFDEVLEDGLRHYPGF